MEGDRKRGSTPKRMDVHLGLGLFKVINQLIFFVFFFLSRLERAMIRKCVEMLSYYGLLKVGYMQTGTGGI